MTQRDRPQHLFEAAYQVRIEKFREEMSKLSRLIEHQPPHQEIRRLLQKPSIDESSSSESSGEELDRLLDGGQLQRDLLELKGLSVQQSLLDSSTNLKQQKHHIKGQLNSNGTVNGEFNGSASCKNLTGQQETTTFVQKVQSEMSVGATEQEHSPELLKPIGRENNKSAPSEEQAMVPTEGKPQIRKKTLNRKVSIPKAEGMLHMMGKQQSIPKSASNKDLKRQFVVNSNSSGFKGSRSKPVFDMYNNVPSGMVFERPVLHHQQVQSPMHIHALSKINAKKVQARRIDSPTEQSNDLRKKLLLNLSQTKSQLQRLVEQRHLARAYQIQTRRYESLAQSVSLSELEKQLEGLTITSFPYRTETLRLICEFIGQFSRKVNQQLIAICKSRGDYDKAMLASLPVLQMLTAKLCSNNILSQEKYKRFAVGTDVLWASLKETKTFDRVQLLRPFQLLQALKQYLEFLVTHQLVELSVKRNLFTKRKVCGYYSHRSHRDRSRNANQKGLDRSYKNEGRTLQAARSEKKLDRPEWELKEFKQQLQAKRQQKPSNNQLSTRSRHHLSPVGAMPSQGFGALGSPLSKPVSSKAGKYRKGPL